MSYLKWRKQAKEPGKTQKGILGSVSGKFDKFSPTHAIFMWWVIHDARQQQTESSILRWFFCLKTGMRHPERGVRFIKGHPPSLEQLSQNQGSKTSEANRSVSNWHYISCVSKRVSTPKQGKKSNRGDYSQIALKAEKVNEIWCKRAKRRRNRKRVRQGIKQANFVLQNQTGEQRRKKANTNSDTRFNMLTNSVQFLQPCCGGFNSVDLRSI